MNLDLQNALGDSKTATDRWIALTDDLTFAQANWRPAAGKWSIIQCLEHLCTTTGRLLPRLDHAVVRAREHRIEADGPFKYGLIGRWFLRSQSPVVAKPLSAPAAYRPTASELDPVIVLNRFLKIQEGFESVLTSASGLDLARIRVSSPAFPLLRLQLGIWFLSTAAHTLRHLNQAERVRSDPRFPAE